MNLARLRRFLRSTTARLAVSYLAVIMVLSLGFSIALYQVSWHELDHQIPPPKLFSINDFGFTDDTNLHNYYEQRIDEIRAHLIGRLVALNLLVLAGGAYLSYYLARRTLDPIETAMAEQSRFVADASHELRTPLTSILTTNEVALRKPGLTLARAKQLLNSNTEEMSRLKLLSDSLLSLAKSDEPLKLSPLSLQDVVSDSINQILPAAQHKKVSIEDKVPNLSVLGDSSALTQAVTILLDNAVKYSASKSQIKLTGKTSGDMVELAVHDEGIGIAAADLPRIFDRFYRADPARTAETGGHGIGLSIAQKIVEQHNGQIRVISTPDKGSTFTLRLPAA